MNQTLSVLRREARIACSLKAQPIWFRILKWALTFWFIARFHERPWFPWVVVVALVAALSVHMLYRWRTRGWTRPWGGWNDVAAGR